MKTSRYITLILIIVAALTGAASAQTPYRLPAKHQASTCEVSEGLVASAYESARANSPFVALEAAAAKIRAREAAEDEELSKITGYAAKFLGTRYRLGATGPRQFDCSGFVGYVYRQFGYDLQRDSRSQFKQGQKVGKDELRPGDLLFFSSRSSGKGRVGHVAMVVDVNADGSCTFIHASSSKKGVVYQRFPDNGYYSRHFIGAKRIVGAL